MTIDYHVYRPVNKLAYDKTLQTMKNKENIMGKLGFDIADTTAENSQKKTTRYNYLSVKADAPAKQIRFVTVDGDAQSILSYSEHYVKFNNTWSRAFSCPDFMNDGPSTCIICKVKAGKNADVLENNFANKFIMQVIERDAKDPDPETKRIPTEGTDTLKAFKFSPFLWTTLNAYRKENGTLGDRDYMISMVKTMTAGKSKIAYIVEPVTDEASPLTKADKVLIMDKPNLLDIEPAYDEAEFNRMQAMTSTTGDAEVADVKSTINEFLGGGSKAESDEDILSSLPTVKSKPDSVAVADEDDDDEDDDNKEFFKTLKKHKA